jgi:hypothetical protein
MASRKSMKRSHPYINASATKDSSDPTHMSCEQLEASLTQIGIKLHANLPTIVLRTLLIENMNTASTDVPKSLRMIMQILVLFSLNHHPFRHVIYQ